MTEKRRITITLTDEISQSIEELKKEQYYSAPYAEVFRSLIELGLKAAKEQQGAAAEHTEGGNEE